jgi:hypothetical protein
MEPKQYPVPTFSGKSASLELVDGEGNPFKPSKPVDYKIIGEDGSILKKGTIQDDNLISLEDIATRKFRVEVDSYFVAETEGFQHIEKDDETEETQEQEDDTSADQQEEPPSEQAQPQGETLSNDDAEEDRKEAEGP